MLKALVQLFAEKFIESKSEWIGRQAYPSRRVTLSTSLTEYVPPADGYVGIYRNKETPSNSVDVYSYGADGNIVSRKTLAFLYNSDAFAFSGVIPVKKGYRIVISGTFNEIWFSPAVGSKL